MNENNTMQTELNAAEGVKAVEETKEQIKEETAPKPVSYTHLTLPTRLMV